MAAVVVLYNELPYIAARQDVVAAIGQAKKELLPSIYDKPKNFAEIIQIVGNSKMGYLTLSPAIETAYVGRELIGYIDSKGNLDIIDPEKKEALLTGKLAEKGLVVGIPSYTVSRNIILYPLGKL